MRNTITAAVVAALVAAGASSAATSMISGHAIRPHSIPLNRLARLPHLQTQQVDAEATVAAGAAWTTATATCPKGWRLTGGGGETDEGILYSSDAANTGQAWTVAADNTGQPTSGGLTATAICTRLTP